MLVASLALAVVGGLTGVLLQWRQAEAARRDAEASEAQVHELLNELLLPNAETHANVFPSESLYEVGLLRNAEARFRTA